MAKGFVHTIYRGGRWLNEIEGERLLPGTYATKEVAVAAGRERARSEQTEHVIHTQGGEFEEQSSYRNEPDRTALAG
jgi:hypothetical protein